MKEETFSDITDEVDALLDDAELRPSIAKHREEMADADRRYAMGLAAVRNAFDLTQTELAQRLGVSQANIAKIEKRSDLLVSTLRAYLAALGGEVRIVVAFQGHDIEVSLEALEKADA
ncbi:MAG: helix-turn-helix domain-containing protein [Nocardioidaceae bacterium]